MVIKLKDMCDVRDGTHDSPTYVVDGYPLVTSKNIVDGKLDLSVVSYISQEDYDKINERSNVDDGDIIMPMIGTIGNPCLVQGYTDFAIKNVALIKFPDDRIKNKYILYFLKSNAFKGYVASKNKGGTQKFLSLGDIRNIEIPQLSTAEQEEVICRLEKMESVIKLRERELEQLDNLIKARFVELFGDVRHEEKYPGIPLRKLCSTISGGTPSTKFPEYYEGEIPWISTVSLGPNHIDGSTAKGYITEEAIENSATKLIPAGNILFGTRVGVGKSSLNDVDICTNQDIVAIVGIDETKYSKLFIKHVLDAYQPYFDSIKKGATILGITGEDLKASLIPEVPIELQKEYEKFVEQVDKSKFKKLCYNNLEKKTPLDIFLRND